MKDKKNTYIQITKALAKKLSKMKLLPRESYNSVIERLTSNKK